MKERPILFNGEMVRAVLDGRKTQTRRIVKEPEDWELLSYLGYSEQDRLHSFRVAHPTGTHDGGLQCPYGVPGERLWTRETWGYRGSLHGSDPVQNLVSVHYHADDTRAEIPFDSFDKMNEATPKQNIRLPKGFDDLPEDEQEYIYDDLLTAWWKRKQKIPSIHMPRWASRTNLKVNKIRVERVQDITVGGILAEGVTVEIPPLLKKEGPPKDYQKLTQKQKDKLVGAVARATYMAQCDYTDRLFAAWIKLWDSINAKRGFGWDVNPWLWVIEFKEIK